MINKPQILEDLHALVEKKIITAETALNIRNYYNALPPVANKKNWFNIIFSLGIIFISLGFLCLIAYNLNSLSQLHKLLLSVFLLISLQALTFFTVFKKSSLPFLIQETILLIYCLGMGGSLILVHQTFTLGNNFGDFILLWLVLILPLIYLKALNTPMIFYNFLAFFWLLSLHTNDNYWLILPIIAASLPAIVNRSQNLLNYHQLSAWQFTLNVFIACFIIYDRFNNNLSLQFAILIAIFFALLSKYLATENCFHKPLRILGYSCSHLLLLFATTNHAWSLSSTNSVNTPFFLGIAFLSILLTSILLWKKRALNFAQKIFQSLAITIICLSFLTKTELALSYFSLVASLHVLFLYLSYIRAGFIFLDKQSLNWGMLGLIALIILKIYDYNLTFFTKGVVFIMLGLSFIFVNKFLEKKQRGIIHE